MRWRFDQGVDEGVTFLPGGGNNKNSPEAGQIKFLAEKLIVKRLTASLFVVVMLRSRVLRPSPTGRNE